MTLLRKLAAALALCSLSMTAAAAEKPPEILKGGSWTMDYAADSCRLGRSFGDPEDPMLLFMEFTKPSGEFQLVLVGDRFATKDPRPEVRLQWGPSDRPAVVRSLNSGRLGNKPMLLGSGTPFDNDDAESDGSRTALSDPAPFASAQQESAARTLLIGLGEKSIVLETGSMHPPMEAARACMDKLVESWGLDPAQQKTLSRYPTPIARSTNWLATSVNPPAALRTGEEARVNFRLIVGADGKPEKCNVQSATVDTGFEEGACRALMRRTRFKPAFDAQGTPVRSFYFSSVTWIIP